MIDDHYCHSPKKIWLDVIKTDVHVTIVIDDVIYVISDWSAKKSGPFRFGVDEKTTWDRHSRCERLLLVFIAVAAVSAGHHLPTWRIHGAGIFMVLHGSHEYTPLMLAYIYIPYMDPEWEWGSSQRVFASRPWNGAAKVRLDMSPILTKSTVLRICNTYVTCFRTYPLWIPFN